MSEQPKVKLFREKSLEAVESPESLNDYLRVTSPRIWLILAAVIALLVGAILWGIFGHIRTTATVAVEVKEGKSFCYIPFMQAEGVISQGKVTLNGTDYYLTDNSEQYEYVTITVDDDVRLRKDGNLNVGDLVVRVPMEDTGLESRIYSGTAVVEDLHPISLLLQ